MDIDNIDLPESEKEYIIEILHKNFTERAMNYYGSYERFKNEFTKLYIMRYKLNYTCREMANYFNLSIRTIETRLTKVGWNYNRFEGQQLAARKSRDYTKIAASQKKTALRNYSQNKLLGSKPEEYIRHYISIELTNKLPEYDVIVGVNNISIIAPLEIDIPIILLYNDKIYKYTIEVNGNYFHNNKEKETSKIIMTNNKGYKHYVICLETNDSNSDKRLEEKANIIINNIIDSLPKRSDFLFPN